MTDDPLDAALYFAHRGWAVFPCHEPTASGCSCRRPDCSSPAKHPRTRRGFRDATTDPATIARWWRQWPTANVALRTGGDSGLVVLDVDPDHGGLRSLTELQRRHGALPPSLAVHTGSGGSHYWFAHPGRHVHNSAGRLGPGIDVRGDGGYVIAPPSVHHTGRAYQWATHNPIAPLPEWVFESAPALTPPPPPRSLQYLEAGPWARAALHAELGRIHASVPGSRNHILNRAAFSLGQLVAAGHLADEDVRDALVAAGLSCGLSPREVGATVASGLRAGSHLPRHPPPRNPSRAHGEEIRSFPHHRDERRTFGQVERHGP
jgi:hypothetical protein